MDDVIAATGASVAAAAAVLATEAITVRIHVQPFGLSAYPAGGGGGHPST